MKLEISYTDILNEQKEELVGSELDIYRIDATLIISLDEKVFFHEEYFPVLEFAVDLKKWLKSNKRSLYFCTVDFGTYGEDSILDIIHYKGKKYLHSAWQQFDAKHLLFEEQYIKDVLSEYLEQLDAEIIKEFGHNIDYYASKKFPVLANT
jgi:hypothetical protein